MNIRKYTDGLNNGIVIGLAAVPASNRTVLQGNKRVVPKAAINVGGTVLATKCITISNNFSAEIAAKGKVATYGMMARTIHYKI
jgi:hypothetical protein